MESQSAPRAVAGHGTAGAQEVLNAIEIIPEDKKTSFLKAMDRCPDVLEGECDLNRFLRCLDCDFWKAAESVVNYWELREELFGERAFLPLTQTSEGALSTEDVMALQTGSFALLRKTPSGEGVMFVDRTRFLPKSTTEAKLRALFYMTHQLSLEGEASEAVHCHILVLLITPRTAPIDFNFVRGAIKIINFSPAKHKLHLLMCLPKTGSTPLIQSVMAGGLSFASTNMGGLEVHSKPFGPPILNELACLGLSPADLPAVIGGTWKYENHSAWCRSKVAEEQERTTLPATTKRAAKKAPEQNEENKRKRAKSLNVIHSRQKRERRKAELVDLQSSRKRLSEELKFLRAENARLQRLFSEAQKMVAAIESSRTQASVPGQTLSQRNTLQLLRDSEPTDAFARASVDNVSARAISNVPIQNQSVGSAVESLLNQPPDVQRLLAVMLEQKLQSHSSALPPPAPLQGLAGDSSWAPAARISGIAPNQEPSWQGGSESLNLRFGNWFNRTGDT